MSAETAEQAVAQAASLTISQPLAWTIAALVLVGLGLGLRVIVMRLTMKVGIGDGGHRVLKRAIRAHANFAEWVPLTILALAAAELRGWGPTVIGGLGAVLVVARIGHGFGLSRFIGVSIGRTGGMSLNLIILLVAAVMAAVGG